MAAAKSSPKASPSKSLSAKSLSTKAKAPAAKVSAKAKADDAPRVLEARFVAGAAKIDVLPAPALAEVAFAGRSNVGKSSLLNVLLQRTSLARTSRTPGRTRQINLFAVTLPGDRQLQVADLPGYGYAKVSKSEKGEWGPLMESYLRGRPTLRAVAVLVDIRRGLEDDDLALVEFLREAPAVARSKPVEVFLVATKVDKLSLAHRKPAVAALAKAAGAPVLPFSALSGEGAGGLWKRLLSTL